MRWLAVAVLLCGAAACKHDFMPDSRWVVGVGWGGAPGSREGCTLTHEEPAGTFRLNSPGFYDAVKPGRGAFRCAHDEVGLEVVAADRLTIEGPHTVASGQRFTLNATLRAGSRELDLGKYGAAEWSYAGSIEKAEGCHEGGFGGDCDDAARQFVRALGPGRGTARVAMSGLSASFEVTVE